MGEKKEREKKEKEKEEKEKAEKEKAERKEKAKLDKERRERIEKMKKEAQEQKEKDEKVSESKQVKKKTVKDSKPRARKADTGESSRSSPATRTPISKVSTPKPMSTPASKLKKDENNKKVMETRKAAATKKKTDQDTEPKSVPKKIIGGKGRPKTKEADITLEDSKVDEKSVVEKVSEAIASGVIDNSRVVKEDEEDKESVVEKDQIEEMETSPQQDNDAKELMKEDDDVEVELQKIAAEEEDDEPVPDIGDKLANEEIIENNLKLQLMEEEKAPVETKTVVKMAFNHVKTPDEVDDLPEHEVAVDDGALLEEYKNQEDENKAVSSETDAGNEKFEQEDMPEKESIVEKDNDQIEEKISKDENEKEQEDKQDSLAAKNKDIIDEKKVEAEAETDCKEEITAEVIDNEAESEKGVEEPDNNKEATVKDVNDIISPMEEKSDMSIENVRDNEVVMVNVDQKLQQTPDSEKVAYPQEDNKVKIDEASFVAEQKPAVDQTEQITERSEVKNIELQSSYPVPKDDLVSATSGIYSMTDDIKSEIPVMSNIDEAIEESKKDDAYNEDNKMIDDHSEGKDLKQVGEDDHQEDKDQEDEMSNNNI